MKKLGRIVALIRFMWVRMLNAGKLRAGPRNCFFPGSIIIDGGRCEFGSFNHFSRCVDLEIMGEFKVGSRNFFNRNVKIVCFQRIEIGDDCLIADGVHIYDHDHRFDDLSRPIREQGYVMRPVKIGNNVWIGAKATILKGVTIGDGAVIGANAVVSRDVPAYAVAAGHPAVVVKQRNNPVN